MKTMASQATDSGCRKPPVSPRPQSASPKPSQYPSLIDCEPPASIRSPGVPPQGSKRSSSLSEKNSKQRVRSASAGRSPRHDLEARYWALLFENLHRAVDEIYQTCETDQSVAECKEAVLMLDNYAKEFRSLIAWLKLSKDLEKTPPPNRSSALPTSLSWEVRKSSPGKGFLRTAFLNLINSGCNKRTMDLHSKSGSVLPSSGETHAADKSYNTKSSEIKMVESSQKQGSEKQPASDQSENSVATKENRAPENNINTDTNILAEDLSCKSSSNDLPKIEPESPSSADVTNSLSPDLEKKDLLQQQDLYDTQSELLKEQDSEITQIQAKDEENSVPILQSSSPDDTALSKSEPSTDNSSKDSKLSVLENTESKSEDAVSSDSVSKSIQDINDPSKTLTTPVLPVTSELKSSPSSLVAVSTAATIKNNIPNPSVSTSTKPAPSSGVSTSKTTNVNKPPSTFASTVTNQFVRNTFATTNRQAPNSQGMVKQTATHGRPNYQNKPNVESRKPYSDRRGGFNSTARRGGLGYQSASFKVGVEKRPYTAFNKVPFVANVIAGGGSKLTKDQQKTGSTSSISSTSSGQSWADKVKGISPAENTVAPKTKTEDDDNEGWETVQRGRTRSRTSPIKTTPLNLLSSSLSNLKEEESARKPPLLRRVHTEVNTFSARGSKLVSNSEVSRKPFTAKSAPLVKPIFVKPAKKESTSVSKISLATNKTKPVLNTKPLAGARDGKVPIGKRPEFSRKRPADVKAVIDTNIKRASKVGIEKATVQDAAVPESKGSEEKCESSEFEARKNENSELSEKELLLSQLNKEEESGCDPNSDEESELLLDDKTVLGDEAAETLLEDEKPLEESDEIREIISPNSDLGDDTEEELNTFDDNQIDWDEYKRHKIDQIHQLGLNWGDQMDQLDLELRTPGRAPQMHEKLSSPFRKRSITETLQRHEEKLAKAQEQRERLLEEKSQKFKEIAKKAEDIRIQKEEHQEQLRLTMLVKLQKAEEKRKMQLQKIVRKAHDEEEKVNEIAFINSLEAQNKRHDLLSKEKDHELRLSEIQEERQRKLDEKAAKEVAAEERRKALEAERQCKLQEMQEKRKLKDQKIELQFQEKEKERQELANQKAREREQRLSALSAAQQASMEELLKKIQQKQEDSARRHEENMEQIRLKAFELSIRCYSSNNDDAPRLVPYETKKLCTLCTVLIESEVYLLSHLRGKKHQDAVKDQHQGLELSTEALELYNIKHIIEAPEDQIDPNIALDKERQKALKKRCKKIKQRLVTKGHEWEKLNTDNVPITNSAFKQKFQKSLRDLQRHLSALSSSSWESNIVTSLERLLGECERALEKGQREDKLLFQQLGGTTALLQMLQQILLRATPEQTPQVVPDKTLVRAAVVYRLACLNCPENSLNTLLSNKVVTLLDLLMHRLKELVPDNRNLTSNGPSSVPVNPVAGALLLVLATALQRPPVALETDTADITARIQDIVGYAVSVGIVDKLSHYLGYIRGPLDGEPQAAEFVLNVVAFLTSLAARLQGNRYEAVFERRKEDDTQLLATLQVTELSGTVSVLYGMLLHGGAPPRAASATPTPMTTASLALSLAALRMLNRIALLDYHMLQSVLGREGLSLQLRHIASYLLWFCSHREHPELLHEVILLVGYFALLHPDNQVVLQSGQCPSVLQQLCSLPFRYFSDPALTGVLFPTLVSCCYNSPENRLILEQEMSPELLANYIEASLLDIHQASLSGRTDKKAEEELRFSLAARFPKNKWTVAKRFFEDRSA